MNKATMPDAAPFVPPGLRTDAPPEDPRKQLLAWGIDLHARCDRQPAPDPRWMIVQWQRHASWGAGYWAWAVPGRVTEAKVLGWQELPALDVFAGYAARLTDRVAREAADDGRA